MRDKIVAGNWKMNMNLEEAEKLWISIKDIADDNVKVLAFPPSVYLGRWSADQNHVKLGAQNCYCKQSGAFTGEIAPAMLKSLGIEYALVGHSERRTLFGESDELIKQKVDALLEAGMKVIFCCGEPLEVRKDNQQNEYVANQVKAALWHLDASGLANITLAYEPIWAIGTGETATPDQAQEMHQHIRKLLMEHFGSDGHNRPILYGGSCKPENAYDLFANEDVDGGLIGGASLQADSFKAIVEAL